MSIFPKIIKKGENKSVTFHIHLENKTKKDIAGEIVFTITDPKDKKEKIREKVIIKGLSKIDEYYNYPIKKNAPVGRYYVDGRFKFEKDEVRSETYRGDFFDIRKK